MEALPGKQDLQLAYLGSLGFESLGTGGKASSLHQLKAAGFAVPPGFVVPPNIALDRVQDELKAAVAALGGYPLAVRSNAELEDLSDTSFAGQYATRLEVADPTGLFTAIASCRNSGATTHVVAYRERNGFAPDQVEIGVLVQQLVDACVAGVVFSIDPHTGREEHALIECCHGLGDRVLSGQTTPTRYVARLEDGYAIEHSPGDECVTLSPETLRNVCRCALEIQAYFGLPQDIEWALDRAGQLWVLQSRPVTRINWRREVDDFTNANFRDGGVAARVCTPLMYSLYGAAFQQSLQQYFSATRLIPKTSPQQAWISRFYGRPYWNASVVKQAMSKVPGYDEERFDHELGIQKDYGARGPIRTPMNLRTMISAVPIALALQKEFRRQLRIAENYGRRFVGQEANYLKALESCSQMSDDDFFSLLVAVFKFHKQTESDYLKTVCNHVNYQAEFNRLLVRMQAATGEAMAPVVLMSGLQDISHMKIERGLLMLVRSAKEHGIGSAEWNGDLARFLTENSFYSDAQLDISTARWGESPEHVTRIVEQILHSAIEPKDAEVTAREQFELYCKEVRRVNRLLQRSMWHRLRFGPAFRKRLKMARTYASRREQMREYSMRADNVARRYLLEAGRRLHGRGWLKEQQDVFMLSTEELVAVADRRESQAHMLSLSEIRRLMYRGYRLFNPPGELGRAIAKHRPTSRSAERAGARLLKGTGCSCGKVIGRARVVPTLAECGGFQAGDVLVTRFIDPAWTLVMGLVSAIVAEVGGLLSHGAVIAREYGLPAALDVAGATQLIKTGQLVEVDGASGTVTILEEECLAAVGM